MNDRDRIELVLRSAEAHANGHHDCRRILSAVERVRALLKFAAARKAIADHVPEITNVDHRALGHYLRQQREAAGLSRSEVARRMEVQETHVLNLESGLRAWNAHTMATYLLTCQESAEVCEAG